MGRMIEVAVTTLATRHDAKVLTIAGDDCWRGFPCQPRCAVPRRAPRLIDRIGGSGRPGSAGRRGVSTAGGLDIKPDNAMLLMKDMVVPRRWPSPHDHGSKTEFAASRVDTGGRNSTCGI
jgi:hypothetical protein